MRKLIFGLLTIATFTLSTFAQQTLPSRDGAAQIENGSAYLKLAVDADGAATITPSGGSLAIAGTITPTSKTGSGLPVYSSGATVTNLTVTSGTFAGTTVAATTSLTVGGGAAMIKFLSAAAELDFGSIETNQTASLTITVTGAGTNSVVLLGMPPAISTNIMCNAYVSATNTVTVKAANISQTAFNPAAGDFRATVIQY